MFDCIDTPLPEFDTPSADHSGRRAAPAPQPAAQPVVPSDQLARRHAGRNWARFAARPGRQAALARLREVALYLDAQVERLADGGVLVLDLSLNETLALVERFGGELAVEAGIAGHGSHP